MFLEQNMTSAPFFCPTSILQMHDSHEDPTNRCEAEGEELSDDCFPPGEKKRRLNVEQVRALEKSFDLGNKLESERKMQLAKALGLQPRQIAIWFQNRRARWKTKQLEKDYVLLKRRFEELKAENDALLCHNKKLQAEIMALKKKAASELINLNKDVEGSCSNRSENSPDPNLETSRTNMTAPAAPAAPAAAGTRSLRITAKAYHSSQLLQSPSTPDIYCGRNELGFPSEHFGSLLGGMEDQAAFWPWPEHHNHH